MHERAPSRGVAPVRAQRPAREARPAPTPAQRVLAYQRAVGNATVSRWLSGAAGPIVARDTPPALAPVAPPVPRISYVFLMGDVKRDSFYLAAREYFSHMVKGAVIVTDKRTLAEVIDHVNAGGRPVDTLYVVSHANESGNLGFSMDAADLARDRARADRKPRTEFSEVKAANEAQSLPAADTSLIDSRTRIQIKGCNIGRSTLMLDELDKAFGGEASVTAPTHTQEYRFSGKGAGATYEENLSELFIEEPGIVTKSRTAVAAAFQAKYPMVPAARWKTLLTQVKVEDRTRTLWTHTQPDPPRDDAASVFARLNVAKRFPKSAKWVVTYKGRTTVGDMWQFDVVAERVLPDGSTEFQELSVTAPIPPSDSDLIDQEKAKHGRPDAYRWRVARTVARGRLKLEVIAEATEWVIAGTIRDASGPYRPPQSDAAWYGTSTYAPPPPATP